MELGQRPMARIYLSGPMSGLPGLNFETFNAEAKRLRALGYEVVNPAEINPDCTKTWHECMRADIRALMTCDTVALLPGWAQSQGAQLEQHLGHRVGMQVVMAAELTQPRQRERITSPGGVQVDMDGAWVLPGVGA